MPAAFLARTTAQRSSPYVVTVFDVGEADGLDYMVMPFVGGRTLARVMTALVSDFGIARLTRGDPDLTRTGQIVGHPGIHEPGAVHGGSGGGRPGRGSDLRDRSTLRRSDSQPG